MNISNSNSNTMPASNPLITFEHKRDAYGFSVRPQHVQRYREYAKIYEEEEEERSNRWKSFLERQAESADLPPNGSSLDKENKTFDTKTTKQESRNGLEKDVEANYVSIEKLGLNVSHDTKDEEKRSRTSKRIHRVYMWTEIRPSLRSIEDMMSIRVNKKGNLPKYHLDNEEDPSDDVTKSAGGLFEEDSEDEFYDVERSDPIQDISSSDCVSISGIGASAVAGTPFESFFPGKEELEILVRGGVPMALRGELWQAFLGVRARRVDNYYQDLLASETYSQNHVDTDVKTPPENLMPEKWKGQIEKDLPRTFPGHPMLDDDNRNALRRLLSAYARHNPSVGYCQGMNFFAALLLLLMPEENAFWALIGIIDDYFGGYYSEEMLECQVDQHAFEELVGERFPKLVNHLDYLGVQVTWVTGPWFLSIFINMLPWETVLRVWDVLLFEGNREMLFRTALALLEFYGPALVTTKDAGDAVTLLQSLAGSTFDSSQLALTACMGYQNVNETRLQELRNKHRPAVLAAVKERTKDLQAWRDSQDLTSKLYNFKHGPKSLLIESNKQNSCELSCSDSGSTNADEVLMNLTREIDSIPDFQDQVVWLKFELCKLLEEKRSAVLRAEELESALMEMVKLDNRRELSARVEQLEQEASELRRALSDKQEQEKVMLQVLMRVEQEQKVTEDARRFAEQDAAAQRSAALVLQEKYEEVLAALADMEKRAVTAESTLEATLQYQSGNSKAQSSPWFSCSDPEGGKQDATPGITTGKIGLLSRPFGLGWRDRNKV